MNARSRHGCSLNLNRLKNCNRIDKSRSRGTPLYLDKLRVNKFVLPLKRDGVSREFCGAPETLAISDIVVGEHKSVRRKIVLLDLMCEVFNRLRHVFLIDHTKIHRIKALTPKPVKLCLLGIAEIDIRLIRLRINRRY